MGVAFSRSPGPGGQSVNAADSRVELVFDLANSGAFTAGQTDRARRRLCHRLNEGVLVVAVSEHRFPTGSRACSLVLRAGRLAPAGTPAPAQGAANHYRRATALTVT